MATIWIIILPQDYTFAEVEVARSTEEIKQIKQNWKDEGKDTHYVIVQKENV